MWIKALMLTVAVTAPVLMATGPAWADRDDRRTRVGVSVRYEERWGGRGHDRPRYEPVRYQTVRYERVLVEEGYYRREWVPPVCERRIDECGREYTVVVREGYHREVWVPARYEMREVRCSPPPPPPCPPPRPRCDDRSGISIIFSTRW